MKLATSKLILSGFLSLSLAQALPALGDGASVPADGSSRGLSLTIRCTNANPKVGDPIPIEFTITNHGTADYSYHYRNYDRSGRMREYRLVAKSKSGDTVPDPRAHWLGGLGGGLSTPRTLRPEESFTMVIPLNRWALITSPGSYSVTGTYLVLCNRYAFTEVFFPFRCLRVMTL